MSTSNQRIFCVHVGGQIVQQPNGPSYTGGTALLLSMPRGITLVDMRELIANSASLPSAVMKIIYAFPVLSFPHTMYTYVGVEVVDDNGVNTIFDVSDNIPGYTPTLYTEVVDETNHRHQVGGSQCDSMAVHVSTQRSNRRDERRKSKHIDDNTYHADDMHHDSNIMEQCNDYVEDDIAFQVQ